MSRQLFFVDSVLKTINTRSNLRGDIEVAEKEKNRLSLQRLTVFPNNLGQPSCMGCLFFIYIIAFLLLFIILRIITLIKYKQIINILRIGNDRNDLTTINDHGAILFHPITVSISITINSFFLTHFFNPLLIQRSRTLLLLSRLKQFGHLNQIHLDFLPPYFKPFYI